VIEDEAEEFSVGPMVDNKKAPMTETDATTEVTQADEVDEGVPEKVAESRSKVPELPADVRAKLQRLENLQSKYKGTISH
jgi:hypothetical protein